MISPEKIVVFSDSEKYWLGLLGEGYTSNRLTVYRESISEIREDISIGFIPSGSVPEKVISTLIDQGLLEYVGEGRVRPILLSK